MILVIGCSITLQLTAAVLAFKLIRLTGRYNAWVIIATALFLVAILRIISFYFILTDDPSCHPETFNEVLWLVISILIVAGIANIDPLIKLIKQSEKVVKDSEEKYLSLFNNANDAIYIVDYQALKILDCNIKASEMIGYTLKELKDLTFPELHPRIEKNILQSKLKQFGDNNLFHDTMVLHHKKKQGGFVIIEMNTRMIDITGEKLILIFVRDITERKLNDDKIRLFFQASENSVEAIGMSDLDKRIIYINNSFEKMFGYTKDELIGKKVSILYPEETFEKLQKSTQDTPNGGWVRELTGKRKDGSLFSLSVSSSRILNDDQTLIARMATHRDITEIKRAEEEMISYTEQLRLLSDHHTTIREEERLTLAREIHDGFGSSLTGLKMDLMLLRRNILDCYGHDLNLDILNNIHSMSDLIDTTIGLMRRLVKELRPEILDELGLVEAVRWYINEFEKRTNIKFRLTIFPKNLKTDSKRSITLFRIFQEILINIARHSKATEVTVFLRKQKEMIYLLIHDNGIGITQEEINNKKSFGILGMRERALVFGGKLNIDGSEGKGTTVKVEIPVK